ncbi:protein NLRC3-like [Sinocyclocheilus rhinocerous]|uniref:protein NLRC3-like n=1 Tax=Sinocyclocheilus rhinocerous TaxID=307959 RepID=UPI0007B7DEE7|nr:PREDICTED: protein NLRC3-like [Sinocyclocheilus rhinocerous]
MLSQAESGEIPKTLTQIYTHFLMAQINIKDTKYNEKKDTDKKMIFKLGKLAYKQLEKGNGIFYEEDLRECGIDVTEASVYSGLCTQIFREEFGLYQGKVFCFVHLSIQEHLAALYVHLSCTIHDRNVFDLDCGFSSDSPTRTNERDNKQLTAMRKQLKKELDVFDLKTFVVGSSKAENMKVFQKLLPVIKESRSVQ